MFDFYFISIETKETKETEKATEKETEKSKDHQSKPASKETKAAKPAYKKVSDVKYAKSNVNVRSGPGTSHKKIGSLKAGQKVTRIGVADNGWGVIDFNGKEGYVSGNYLVDTKPAAQTAEKPKDSKPAETKAKPAEPKGQDAKKDETKPAEKTEYVPLAEGWIYEKSLTDSTMNSTQQAKIDGWVKTWKDGGMSDEELKREIQGYLSTEGLSFNMIFVYNKSRFISDHTDVVSQSSGEGAVYSYEAVYCTGERDPNSYRDYTVFYSWSVTVFRPL